MPKAGWKSITIPESLYDDFMDYYKKNKKVSDPTLSAFLVRKMDEIHEDKQHLRKLARKIQKVPKKYTETQVRIKHD